MWLIWRRLLEDGKKGGNRSRPVLLYLANRPQVATSGCAGQCHSRSTEFTILVALGKGEVVDLGHPRTTKSAFQLLKSFKLEEIREYGQRREAAVRIFSARRWHRGEAIFRSVASSRPFLDDVQRIKRCVDLVRSFGFLPLPRRTLPRSRVARRGEKSNSSGEQRAECRRESETNGCPASKCSHPTLKLDARWRHKRKKHEDASPLCEADFCCSTVMPDAIISGSVNVLAMKALMMSHRKLPLYTYGIHIVFENPNAFLF